LLLPVAVDPVAVLSPPRERSRLRNLLDKKPSWTWIDGPSGDVPQTLALASMFTTKS